VPVVWRRLGVVLLTSPLAFAASAGPALAQAWLPPKGEATFSLVYQNVYQRDHLFGTTRHDEFGHMYYQNLFADLSYSVSDRFSLRLNVPYVSGTYQGSFPHLFPVDDGSYHGSFQDARFEVRFSALRAPFALTPFIGGIQPLTSYEHYAHAATGSGLRQLLVGAGFGRSLDPILKSAYFQGRYSYAFVERLENAHSNTNNRSNLTLEVGYFIVPSFNVFAVGMGQKTHGGIPFVIGKPFGDGSAADLHNHDRISRADSVDVGGGVGYSVNPWLDVFGMWVATVWGKNGHALNRGLTFGVSMSFSPHQLVRRMRGQPPGDLASGS
jgi:hypothetical protein